MHGEDLVARKTLEKTVFNHLAGAATDFLGGLKDEVHGALPVLILSKGDGCAKQHGGVTVVTATVHFARDPRTVGKLVFFGEWQGVHIGTQANGAAATAFLDHAHKPSFAQTAMHGDAPRLQFFSNQGAGAFFSKTQFGVGVDVAAQGLQMLAVLRPEIIKYWHHRHANEFSTGLCLLWLSKPCVNPRRGLFYIKNKSCSGRFGGLKGQKNAYLLRTLRTVFDAALRGLFTAALRVAFAGALAAAWLAVLVVDFAVARLVVFLAAARLR